MPVSGMRADASAVGGARFLLRHHCQHAVYQYVKSQSELLGSSLALAHPTECYLMQERY
jgi:hypothetical protein